MPRFEPQRGVGDRDNAPRPPPPLPASAADAVHATVREARALKSAQGRRQQHRFLLEGVRLIEDALEQGVELLQVFITPHLLDATPRGAELGAQLRRQNVPVIELPERLLGLVADTETPAGIVAVAPLPPEDQPLPMPWTDGLSVVLLDHVRDPGNVGAILRTSGASGVAVVVSTEGSVDLYAPKVVRAGAGAHFRLTLFPSRSLELLAEWLGVWPQVVLADGKSRSSLYDLDWQAPTILILANEAHGPSSWLSAVQMRRARIPMRGATESLNVAAAAAILLYEARRAVLKKL